MCGTSLQSAFTFRPQTVSSDQYSLPQRPGMLPALLLISQTNYSRFAPQWPPLTNGQLTDPHIPCIRCFVWGLDAKRFKRFSSLGEILLGVQAARPKGFTPKPVVHMAGCWPAAFFFFIKNSIKEKVCLIAPKETVHLGSLSEGLENCV